MGLLSNLVPVSIIPKDSYATQKDHPLGSGPFKFMSYDNRSRWSISRRILITGKERRKYPAFRVRVIADTNALQAELQSGRVDIAPLPTSLSPDAIKSLGQYPNLQVLQFTGSNLNLLTFNRSQTAAGRRSGEAGDRLCDRSRKPDPRSASGTGKDCPLDSAGRVLGIHAGTNLYHSILRWRRNCWMKPASEIRTVMDHRCVFPNPVDFQSLRKQRGGEELCRSDSELSEERWAFPSRSRLRN